MDPSTSLHRSIRPLLAQVGLDDKQTEIYLALLSLKTDKVVNIAKASGQSRSHTYIILRELEEMGLVSESKDGAVLKFHAESPEKLMSFLKDREIKYRDLQTLVEGALPLLKSLTPSYVSSPQVTTLKGIDGMKQVYRDILTQEFVGIYNVQASLDMFGSNIVTMLFGEEPRLKGRDLLVNNEGAMDYLRDVPTHEGYAVRLLPEGIYFKTDTIVYGNYVTMFTFDDQKTTIRIESREMADSFRAWFDMMWDMSDLSSILTL